MGDPIYVDALGINFSAPIEENEKRSCFLLYQSKTWYKFLPPTGMYIPDT